MNRNLRAWMGYVVSIIAVFGFGGWIMNVIALFSESFSPLTAMAVMRVVGVFIAPFGAVLGWL